MTVEVFCLEGNWQPGDLRARDTLLPLLELLRCHDEIDFVRRDIATLQEFKHYLALWSEYPGGEFEFGYFAFHGSKRKAVFLDKESLSLRELGRHIGKAGAGSGRIIHIASCYGLRVTEDELAEFLELTDASVVCGYTESVDTLRAAAFELLLLRELRGDWTDYHRRFALIENRYSELADDLGFVWKSNGV